MRREPRGGRQTRYELPQLHEAGGIILTGKMRDTTHLGVHRRATNDSASTL